MNEHGHVHLNAEDGKHHDSDDKEWETDNEDEVKEQMKEDAE